MAAGCVVLVLFSYAVSLPCDPTNRVCIWDDVRLRVGCNMPHHYSDPPKMENLPGAASHGRKLRKSKGRALEASTVQYCDKWGYILIQVGATSWDSCTKLLFNIEGYNFLLRGISLRSTIRKLELHGFLWSGCPLLNFISKKSKIKKLYGS